MAHHKTHEHKGHDGHHKTEKTESKAGKLKIHGGFKSTEHEKGSPRKK